MIDWDKPIETIEGWPAKVLSATYRINYEPFFVVQIECDDGGWSRVVIFDKDGCVKQGILTTKIRNVPVKREGWIAIYKTKDPKNARHCSIAYPTKEDCIHACCANKVVAYVKVEWEEYP